MTVDTRQPALILLGPTGSGKTPLGEALQKQGFRQHPCLHFDFGENLRQAVARATPDQDLSLADIQFLQHVLHTGALLEDRDFPIAQRLLASFLHNRGATERSWVVMNGLPRHEGQAQALESMLEVRQVVVLECHTDVVMARIASNSGGDRTQRTDDDAQAIRRKLEIFAQRTAPLVSYYGRRQVDIRTIDVTTTMTAEEMCRQLSDT